LLLHRVRGNAAHEKQPIQEIAMSNQSKPADQDQSQQSPLGGQTQSRRRSRKERVPDKNESAPTGPNDRSPESEQDQDFGGDNTQRNQQDKIDPRKDQETPPARPKIAPDDDIA